jgi:hypothetical protein
MWERACSRRGQPSRQKLPLHAPTFDRHPLDRIEHQVLHQQADQNHGRQPGKHLVGVKLVAVLEDVPSQPPLADEAPNTSSAAIKVRQANAQPIFSPARIDGSAAGIRINNTYRNPRSP